ncbi:MAG: hypothetical protein ABIR66_06580 [Saprospiraceae bacterium]
MAKKEAYLKTETLEIYLQHLTSLPNIERKGAAMPYTSIHGHMFSFMDLEGNLALRLPEKERNEFLKKYKTHLCIAHGKVLKEYVAVPKKIFQDLTGMKKYFKQSFDYAYSLPSKS